MTSCAWVTHEPQPLFLAGPTAVGKSAVALAFAPKRRGEIISVDSMQVYRGLRIGTAKPSDAELQQVPHHLLDIADLGESYSAGRFVLEASRAAQEIQRRKRVPILCGGSGLYFQALLEGLGDASPSDPLVRQELERHSLAKLLEELERCDPEQFRTVDRANRRRVVRALEVARTAVATASARPARWIRRGGLNLRGQNPVQPICFVALRRAKEDLHERISRRVERMFAAGLVAETQMLLRAALPLTHGAWQAIGYKQVLEHLQKKYSLDETIERVKQRTRQFAKRQMTWFNRQTDLRWFELAPDEPDQAVASRLVAWYDQHTRSES